AELVERDRPLFGTERDRPLAIAVLCPGRIQLVLDHAQRQELVALQPQDLLQPFEVGFAEEAVPALRPPRREQPLVLEVPDLRDRDVRELLPEPADDLAYPQEPLPLLWRGRCHAMKVRRYLPTCT